MGRLDLSKGQTNQLQTAIDRLTNALEAAGQASEQSARNLFWATVALVGATVVLAVIAAIPLLK